MRGEASKDQRRSVTCLQSVCTCLYQGGHVEVASPVRLKQAQADLRASRYRAQGGGCKDCTALCTEMKILQYPFRRQQGCCRYRSSVLRLVGASIDFQFLPSWCVAEKWNLWKEVKNDNGSSKMETSASTGLLRPSRHSAREAVEMNDQQRDRSDRFGRRMVLVDSWPWVFWQELAQSMIKLSSSILRVNWLFYFSTL